MTSTDDSTDTKEMLPPDSLLELDEYLAMFRALGDRTKFRIVAKLVEGDQTEDELPESLPASREAIASSLSELVDAQLIEKRARNDESGLHRYYRCTIYGKVLLQNGIQELFNREWEMRDAYNSDSGG